MMTVEQENHLKDIKASFNKLVDTKYRRGAIEHGGELMSCDGSVILNYAIDEAIDQVTYLLTLKERLYGTNF